MRSRLSLFPEFSPSSYAGLFSAIILASPALVSAQEQNSNEHKLTPSEVKALLRGASTPEEHSALGAYFKDRASQEEATAKYYDEMAQVYQPKPLPSAFRPLSVRDMRNRSQYFAATPEKLPRWPLRRRRTKRSWPTPCGMLRRFGLIQLPTDDLVWISRVGAS